MEIISLLFGAAQKLRESIKIKHKNDKQAAALVNAVESCEVLVQQISEEQGRMSSNLTSKISNMLETIQAISARLDELADTNTAKLVLNNASISEELAQMSASLDRARTDVHEVVLVESRGMLQQLHDLQQSHVARETKKQEECDKAAVFATFRKMSELQADGTTIADVKHEKQDAADWLFKARQSDLIPILAEQPPENIVELMDPLVTAWKMLTKFDDVEPGTDRASVVLEAATCLLDLYTNNRSRFNTIANQYISLGLFRKSTPYLDSLCDGAVEHIPELASWCHVLEILVRDDETRSVSLAWENGCELMIKIVKTYSTNLSLHKVVLRVLWSLSGPRGASKHIVSNSTTNSVEVFCYTMMLWSTNDEILQTACSALRRLAAHEYENANILARNGVASAVANFLRPQAGYTPMTLTVMMGFEVMTTMIVDSSSATHVMEALGGFGPIQQYLNTSQELPYLFFSGCNLILRLLSTLINSVKYVEEGKLVQHIINLTAGKKNDIVICTPLLLTLRKLSSMDDLIKWSLYNSSCWQLIVELLAIHGGERAFGSLCVETLTNMKQLKEIKILISSDAVVMRNMFGIIERRDLHAIIRIDAIQLVTRSLSREHQQDLARHDIVADLVNTLGRFSLKKEESVKYIDNLYEVFSSLQSLAYNLSDHINADMEIRLLAFAILFASDEISMARHSKLRKEMRENKVKEGEKLGLKEVVLTFDRVLCNLLFADESIKTFRHDHHYTVKRNGGLFGCCVNIINQQEELSVQHDMVLETIDMILRTKCPVLRSGYMDYDPNNKYSLYRVAYPKNYINYNIFFTPACFRSMIYALALRSSTRESPYGFWNYIAFDNVCHMMECMPWDFSVQYYGMFGLVYVLYDIPKPYQLMLNRAAQDVATALLMHARSDPWSDWNYVYTPNGTHNVMRAYAVMNCGIETLQGALQAEHTKVNSYVASFRANNAYLQNIMAALPVRNPNWSNPTVPSAAVVAPRSSVCGRCGKPDTKKKKEPFISCTLCGITVCKSCTHDTPVNIPYAYTRTMICNGCYNVEPPCTAPTYYAPVPYVTPQTTLMPVGSYEMQQTIPPQTNGDYVKIQ